MSCFVANVETKILMKINSVQDVEYKYKFLQIPHFIHTLINTELMLAMFLEISQLTIKLSNNQKLTDDEINRLKNLQDEFQEQIKNRVIKD